MTFGTTAIIDRKKQQAEKREMVMIIMYDMRESLKEIEQCDEELIAFFDLQVDALAHPEEFYEKTNAFYTHLPFLSYTTTTENIFKSNIETVSTIGNILFVETVSSLYEKRSNYRTEVVDRFQQEAWGAVKDYESLADFNSSSLLYISQMYLMTMQKDFEQCKIMMKKLDVFSRERKNLEEAVRKESAIEEISTFAEERQQRERRFMEALEEGKKSLK